MRIPFAMLVLCGVLGLASGCVQRTQIATIAPSHDELPNLAALDSPSPVSVDVEGRGSGNEPRIMLVTPIKEPELTPEEKKILGQRREAFKFLMYNVPGYRAGSRAGTWFGGVNTATDSASTGLASQQGGRVTVVGGAGSSYAGAATATDTFGKHVGGSGGTTPRVGESGPESRLKTDTDRASRIAEPKTRRDR